VNLYLASTQYINLDQPLVTEKALALAGDETSYLVIARCCFEFVRDKIRHSRDYRQNPVTLQSVRRLATYDWFLLGQESSSQRAAARGRHTGRGRMVFSAFLQADVLEAAWNGVVQDAFQLGQ